MGAHERAWRAAAYLADKKGDSNHLISPSEYADIYNFLGVENTGEYALDLTTEQLREYVSQKDF